MTFAPVPFATYAVTPRLSFGSAPTTDADRAAVRAAGFTHVLDLRAEADNVSDAWAPLGIAYRRIPMIDDGRAQPAEAYRLGVEFAAMVLAQPNGKLLVHCHAGQYRSPSMVYAILRAAVVTPADAWARIVAARADASREYVDSAEAAVPTLAALSLPTLLSTPGAAGTTGRSWGPTILGGMLAGAFAFWLGARRPA